VFPLVIAVLGDLRSFCYFFGILAIAPDLPIESRVFHERDGKILKHPPLPLSLSFSECGSLFLLHHGGIF